MCLVFGLRLCPKMLGSLFFFSHHLIPGAGERHPFHHRQWHLPGPHNLPGLDAWEPSYNIWDSECRRECKCPTQVRLSHAQSDGKWLKVLAYIYVFGLLERCLGSTSYNFSDFWVCSSCSRFEWECFDLFGFLFFTYSVLK